MALFSILDHYLRRTDSQERVIGTLLGIRSDNGEVEVRSSFAVLHSETAEQVAVDMDYLRAMYELHHKVNSKEVIVGWLVIFFDSANSIMKSCITQVFNWLKSKHLFRPHPKLLFARDRAAPSNPSRIEHWS